MWQKPYEETVISFIIGGVGALCTLLAVGQGGAAAIAMPLFFVLINLLFTVVIISRRVVTGEKYQNKSGPYEKGIAVCEE